MEYVALCGVSVKFIAVTLAPLTVADWLVGLNV